MPPYQADRYKIKRGQLHKSTFVGVFRERKRGRSGQLKGNDLRALERNGFFSTAVNSAIRFRSCFLMSRVLLAVMARFDYCSLLPLRAAGIRLAGMRESRYTRISSGAGALSR